MSFTLFLLSIVVFLLIVLLLAVRYFNKKQTSYCNNKHYDLSGGFPCEVCGARDINECEN